MTDDLAYDSETRRLDILKQIPPLLPQFLRKRRVGLTTVEELMQELGLDRAELFALVSLNEIQGSYGGPVTPSQVRADDPCSTENHQVEMLAALVGKGLAESTTNGAYSLSAKAKQAIDRLHAAGRAYLARMQPLPPDELDELASQLERASQAIVSDMVLSPRPGSRLAGRLSLATFGKDAPAMVRIEQAILELWGARDDAHRKAWRDAELEGPPMLVLTLIWLGEARTVQDLQAIFKTEQQQADLDGRLSYLIEKDYVVRDGDDVLTLTPEGALVREDIERETDRIYFAPWPQTGDEAEWMCDRLATLIENMATSTLA